MFSLGKILAWIFTGFADIEQDVTELEAGQIAVSPVADVGSTGGKTIYAAIVACTDKAKLDALAGTK